MQCHKIKINLKNTMINKNRRYTLMLDDEEMHIVIGRIKWHQSSNNKIHHTINYGDINIIGDPKPVEIEITGQICHTWPYPEGKEDSPEAVIERLDQFKRSRLAQSFRIIGSQAALSFDYIHYISIETFRYRQSAENGGDYNITLLLKEYKPVIRYRYKEGPDGKGEMEEIRPEYVTEKERLAFLALKEANAKREKELQGMLLKNGDLVLKIGSEVYLLPAFFSQEWEKYIEIDSNGKIYYKNNKYAIINIPDLAVPLASTPISEPRLEKCKYPITLKGAFQKEFQFVYKKIGSENYYVSLQDISNAFKGTIQDHNSTSNSKHANENHTIGKIMTIKSEKNNMITLTIKIPPNDLSGQTNAVLSSLQIDFRNREPAENGIIWIKIKAEQNAVYLNINQFLDVYYKAFEDRFIIEKNLNSKVMSSEGFEMLKRHEASGEVLKSWGLGAYNGDELIGVYPHYVVVNGEPDGGITFGFGHYVSPKEYQVDESEKILVDTYAKGAPISIKNPDKNRSYPVPGALLMPIDKVYELMKEDVKVHVTDLNELFTRNEFVVNQDQFDALVNLRYHKGSLGSRIFNLVEAKNYSKSEWENAIRELITAQGDLNRADELVAIFCAGMGE